MPQSASCRSGASPLTLVNYLLLGCASGAMLATWLASLWAPELLQGLQQGGVAAHAGGPCCSGPPRWCAMPACGRARRCRAPSASSTRTSPSGPRASWAARFNTREFFHGKGAPLLRSVKWFFLATAFALPLLMLALGPASSTWLALAFGVQFVGLLAERWFFFAQANHPQNLYYQVIS